MLARTRVVKAPIESAEPEHEPECASPSCWCSCSRGTCVVEELVLGDDQAHPIPVDDRQGTSFRCPYSVRSSRFLAVLCYVDVAASLSDLKGSNANRIKFVKTLK